MTALQFMLLLTTVRSVDARQGADAHDVAAISPGIPYGVGTVHWNGWTPEPIKPSASPRVADVTDDPAPRPDVAVRYDDRTRMLVVAGSKQKAKIIGSLKNAWIDAGLLNAEQGACIASAFRQSASAQPVMLATLAPAPQHQSRPKRASEAALNAMIQRHIKENCAYEEEVRNVRGDNEGKLLIFEAQRIENPFRALFDGDEAYPSPEMRGVENGLNGAVDILTLGIKPLIAKIVANAKRSEYYQSKGDAICAQRYQRWSLAELAMALDVDGLAFMPRHARLPGKGKPLELKHALPGQTRAAYFTTPAGSGVRREILLEVKPANAMGDISAGPIYLKPTSKKNEFITHHPDAQRPELLERRVIVDESHMTWRYADTFSTAGLNVDIKEGRRQIALYGDYYDLQLNAENIFEVVVKKEGGVREYVPVYQEPLSRTWHMAVHDGVQVFGAKDRAFINRISVDLDPALTYIPGPTNNPKAYGAGIVFQTEIRGDETHYTHSRVLEMGGRLVPVRTCTTPGHGMHFEAYDTRTPALAGRPVAFDGMRWHFEPSTSPTVSPAVARALATKKSTRLPVKIPDSSELSAPDADGLVWDGKDRSFIKVDNTYFRISKQNDNRYVITRPGQQRLHLRIKDGQLHIETARERLQNILSRGLSGRVRADAQAVLVDCGYTRESATALLAQYSFPAQGFYTAYEFARHIEQWEAFPHWAERFKVASPDGTGLAEGAGPSYSADMPSVVHAPGPSNGAQALGAPMWRPWDNVPEAARGLEPSHAARDDGAIVWQPFDDVAMAANAQKADEPIPGPSRRRNEGSGSLVSEHGSDDAMSVSDTSSGGPISVCDPSDPSYRTSLRLGDHLGQGQFGNVFEDADHPEFVIKRYYQAEDDPDDEIHLPHREEETFRQFYGADAAQRYEEADGTQYLRMYRIPGTLLDDLQPNSLPEDALERYVDMLEKLKSKGIMHGDLHPENIMWDGESFWPIDMQDTTANYFAATGIEKAEYNERGHGIWEDTFTKIVAKMSPKDVAKIDQSGMVRMWATEDQDT
ncbi:serine/threonine protein kinase [Robbsia andropogonis]|uniref:serine/threonine protein kinase n=1 Tax=Robbsia andropogonis TaxID=28092 RepID=UPI0012F7CD63|nr:serine/threonine-protein kinase [Robbsia andropogonis]